MFNYGFPLKKKLGPLLNAAVSLVTSLLWETLKKKKKKKICTEESKRHPKIKMEQLDGNWIMDKQQQCP